MKEEWEVGDTLIFIACMVVGAYVVVDVAMPVISWALGR